MFRKGVTQEGQNGFRNDRKEKFSFHNRITEAYCSKSIWIMQDSIQ
jgi:hypothetical protein